VQPRKVVDVTDSSHEQVAGNGPTSTGQLVKQASEQLTELVRSELRLARAELAEKGKEAGVAGGLFGGAGIVAIVAVQAAAATSIIALTLVLPAWASGLVVTALLLLLAGGLAAVGKRHASKAQPPIPRQALEGAQADLKEIKERSHR
jgi:uncharacterized membrane protein YqjE